MVKSSTVLMGFRPLASLIFVALGVIMILMSSVVRNRETGDIHFSGQLFAGIGVLLFGFYLGVVSVL